MVCASVGLEGAFTFETARTWWWKALMWGLTGKEEEGREWHVPEAVLRSGGCCASVKAETSVGFGCKEVGSWGQWVGKPDSRGWKVEGEVRKWAQQGRRPFQESR